MHYLLLMIHDLEWNIPLLLLGVSIAIFYIILVKQMTELTMLHRQPLLFFLSLSLLVLLVGSPLATVSHLSFSLHMIQMSVLFFIIPPLIIVGIPKPIFQLLLKIPLLKVLLVASPFIALIIFSVLFFMYHLPFILNTFSINPSIHTIYFTILFILALRMWWPITSPFNKLRKYSESKERYAFLSGLLLLPACSIFIINAFMDGMNNPFLTQLMTKLCLPSHSNAAALLPPLINPRLDQLMAGLFMLGIHKISLKTALIMGKKV